MASSSSSRREEEEKPSLLLQRCRRTPLTFPLSSSPLPMDPTPPDKVKPEPPSPRPSHHYAPDMPDPEPEDGEEYTPEEAPPPEGGDPECPRGEQPVLLQFLPSFCIQEQPCPLPPPPTCFPASLGLGTGFAPEPPFPAAFAYGQFPVKTEEQQQRTSLDDGSSGGDVTSDEVPDFAPTPPSGSNPHLLHRKRPRSGGEGEREGEREREDVPPWRQQYASKHCMAERKRREKLNDRFQILKELIRPYLRSKDDKTSLLADTVEYIKDLQRRLDQKECVCQYSNAAAATTSAASPIDVGGSNSSQCDLAASHSPAQTADVKSHIEVQSVKDDMVMIEIFCEEKSGFFGHLTLALLDLKLEVQYLNATIHSGMIHQVIHAKVDASYKEEHMKQAVADCVQQALLKNLADR